MNISEGIKSASGEVHRGHPFVIPEYMELYKFEQDFDYHGWHSWMRNNAPTLGFLLVGCYLTLIVVGRQWMKNREPYRLRGLLVFWNVALAGFSMMAFARSVPEVIYLLGKPGGFHESICSVEDMNIASVFWIMAMTLSKSIELGDTAFIVLRKQPLIVLHWFHHATVLMYSFYTWADHDPGHRWFSMINAFIHAFMYSYYALKAIGVKLPRAMALAITSSQLLQMFFGTALNLYSFYAPQMGLSCKTTPFNVGLALAMYASYVVLFSNFFYQSYVQKQKKKKTKKSE